ncbi:MAG: chromate transporter [Acetobacteraceae bacterium]|nr:chromate transporter [Acetobacteraceae bacterium]
MAVLELAWVFARVGLFTFGSGYAMLGLLEREAVVRHAWLSAREFADVVAIAEVTPGPIMVNMATFVGYKVARVPGALMATLGLVLPPILAILVIAVLYLRFRQNRLLEAALAGLRPVVLALILAAVLRLGRVAMADWRGLVLFVAALAAAAAFQVHPIAVALGGVVAGLALFR